jgi:hypothetical protein
MRWDSAVGKATGFVLDDLGLFEFESRYCQEFFLPYVVQTGSSAHPAFYRIGTGVKRPGSEADHTPPTSAEVKKTWAYTSIPPYVFMV